MQYRVFPKENGPMGGIELYWDGSGNEGSLRDELEVVLGCVVSLSVLENAELSRLLSKHYLGDVSAGAEKKELSVISAGMISWVY